MNNGRIVAMNHQEPMPTKSTSANPGLPDEQPRILIFGARKCSEVLGSARKCSEVLGSALRCAFNFFGFPNWLLIRHSAKCGRGGSLSPRQRIPRTNSRFEAPNRPMVLPLLGERAGEGDTTPQRTMAQKTEMHPTAAWGTSEHRSSEKRERHPFLSRFTFGGLLSTLQRYGV
jgi:hypothetical protein